MSCQSYRDGLLDDIPHITSLNLAFNKLSSIPGNAFTRLDMQLQALYINDNQLAEITPGMFNLRELEILDLARNQISQIKDNTFSQTPKLSTLVLLGNFLTEINRSALRGDHSLTDLQLQDNQIETIHSDAFDLVALRTIYLQNNSLASLSSQWFSGNEKLQTVMLQNNLLNSVPEDAFRGCTALESLDLSHNNIRLLPATLLQGLKSLTHFFVDHNEISLENIDTFFFADSEMDMYIRLSNNRITLISSELLSGIKSCAELSLSYNFVSEIHPEAFGESVGQNHDLAPRPQPAESNSRQRL